MLPILRQIRPVLVLTLLCWPPVKSFPATGRSTAPPNYILQWSDHFSGGVLDATKWNYRTDIKARSAQLPANISLAPGGHMNIALRQQRFGPGWSTAAGYHTYGLEWTEQQIAYYLDGSRICSQDYPPTQYSHDPLNIWLTAIGYSPDIAVKDPSSTVSFADVAFYIRDYYIGNGEPGYVEYGPGWQQSPTPGYSNLPARVSCQAGSSASYNPTLLQRGTYGVEVYVVQNADADPAAKLTIQHAGGSATNTIDFSTATTGWVDLGSYLFAAGSGGSVTNANSGVGCTRTSMVKFVRR